MPGPVVEEQGLLHRGFAGLARGVDRAPVLIVPDVSDPRLLPDELAHCNASTPMPLFVKACHITQGFLNSVRMVKSCAELPEARAWMGRMFGVVATDPERMWAAAADVLTATLVPGFMLQGSAGLSPDYVQGSRQRGALRGPCLQCWNVIPATKLLNRGSTVAVSSFQGCSVPGAEVPVQHGGGAAGPRASSPVGFLCRPCGPGCSRPCEQRAPQTILARNT